MSTNRPRIVIYSDDSSVRESIVAGLGSKVAADLPEHDIEQFATGKALRMYLDNKGSADLFIVDGEATPEGGMGIARQLKDELFRCPPVLLITARPDDAWLAAWSRADAVVVHPIDPFTVADRVATLLRARALTSA
ncbi:MAG: DNA-binding response regulator [Streptomycetaceae bacterium]|nr:MAG: DNA-binding response regulator [Streptomycetaceae bacterium]